MVGRRDATLTGQTSHYKGVCGLEEHVGRMSVGEGEAGVAYTGGCADGIGGVVGKAARKKYDTTHWCSCSARIQPPSIASIYAHAAITRSRCHGLVVVTEAHYAAGEVALDCARARDNDMRSPS